MLIQTVDDLRADLPITQKCAYLQTGSYSPVPASTQRYMAEMLIEENEVALTAGSKAEYSDFYQRADVARQTLAGLLGVSADEVAYSTNTTTAVGTASVIPSSRSAVGISIDSGKATDVASALSLPTRCR